MPFIDPAHWSAKVRGILRRYDDNLLRQVSARLYRPRSQWPVEELVERCVGTLDNAAAIDRRLNDLDPASRKLLALMGHSRQPRWKVGGLLEMLAALDHSEGLQPVLTLLGHGLLYPDLPGETGKLKDFEQWVGQAGVAGFPVFAHPHVTARILGDDLGLPDCPGAVREATAPQEVDGLECPLRLAVVWQQVTGSPLRQTQGGDFFKRDLDRLRADALLSAPAAESPIALPDAGLLAVSLAREEGLLQERDGELGAAPFPATWKAGLFTTLESLWAALLQLETWNPRDGWKDSRASGNPYPAAYVLALLLLGRLPDGAWASAAAVDEWVLGHHPYWAPGTAAAAGATDKAARRTAPAFLQTFLLGLAHQLRLVQAAQDARGDWVVRLTDLGRGLLGLAEVPSNPPAYPKTLLVQPNLEIVAYRQGLTPALIASLSQMAAWKSLGPACTLQLQPDTTYRALESGETFESILQTLEQYGMRPTPVPVVESLRTWADKRERINVYAAAALFEFASAADLNEAVARGLPGVRLSDRLLVVPNESQIDYRHFRLTGTRDYSLPPDPCVEVGTDGVTLTVDSARSDLLLETELRRLAEPLDGVHTGGRRQYRLTPVSVAAGRASGFSVRSLEEWFVQRTGQSLSPAARLLIAGPPEEPLTLRSLVVLEVPTPEVADGLFQWPATRALIQSRLGPAALVVATEHIEQLRQRLRELGFDCTS
jgi:hypothetical protein